MLIIIVIFILIESIKIKLSPFQTQEEKQVKPAYTAAMKGINGFKLKTILIIIEQEAVDLFLNPTDSIHAPYTESKLQVINKVVEQMITYLNGNHDKIELWKSYILHFNAGAGPTGIMCTICREDNKYFFASVESQYWNDILDLYVFQNVHHITVDTNSEISMDKEKISQFAMCKNLESIRFRASKSKEVFNDFKQRMKTINLKCEVFNTTKREY